MNLRLLKSKMKKMGIFQLKNNHKSNVNFSFFIVKNTMVLLRLSLLQICLLVFGSKTPNLPCLKIGSSEKTPPPVPGKNTLPHPKGDFHP